MYLYGWFDLLGVINGWLVKLIEFNVDIVIVIFEMVII